VPGFNLYVSSARVTVYSTENYEYKEDQAGTTHTDTHRHTNTQTHRGKRVGEGEERLIRTKTQTRRLTKRNMEAVSVLQAEVERLWEEREGLEERIARIEPRMENEDKRTRGVSSDSFEERMKRSEAAAEEQGRITIIRGKISRVDRQMRVLGERMDRVQSEGGGGEGETEEREGLSDEFERAIEGANGRIEMEQRMLERMRRELSWMRGEM
jgi:chromosome segregation ATPase